MTLRDFNEPDTPCPESMVYFIRLFKSRSQSETAWRIVEYLTIRIGRTILKKLRASVHCSEDQREELYDALIIQLYTEWMSLEAMHEFWEVRFWVCLNRKLMDVIKDYIRQSQKIAPLSPPNDGKGKNPVDEIPDPRPDPPSKAEIRLALASLAEPYKTTIYLYVFEQWTEEEIAHYFKKTSRTVRNYLTRAIACLKELYRERTEQK
jgi:RNA polymerase sigma factor (sigma-70 family)